MRYIATTLDAFKHILPDPALRTTRNDQFFRQAFVLSCLIWKVMDPDRAQPNALYGLV